MRPKLPVELDPGRLMMALEELVGNREFDDPMDPTAADDLMHTARRTGWDDLPDSVKLRCKLSIGPRVDRDHFQLVLGGFDRRTGLWVLPPDPAAGVGDELENDEWRTMADVGETPPAWPVGAEGLIHPRRVACLGGAPKAGKTTAAAAAAAGVAYGVDWLTGDIRQPGKVLWLGAPGESPEEEIRHLLVRAGLPPERETLERVIFEPVRRLSEIVQKLERKPIEGLQAVVVDSLRGLLSAHGADENDSGAVRDILGMLATIAESGPGVLVLHHFRRDREAAKGDRMRGSGDILAGVDLTVEFDRTAIGARLSYSGRTGSPTEDLHLVWSDGRYSVADGPAPVDPGGGGGRGWTDEHQGFLMAWASDNPTGSARACSEAMRAADLRARNETIRDRLKCARGARGAPGAQGRTRSRVNQGCAPTKIRCRLFPKGWRTMTGGVSRR